MDLIKIGKYIAGKRKSLGMTQKQLAEKLGMSDKSVSKWERGVCLPDVSVYKELCSILGISLNEFLAGEDIAQENMIQKSETNIIEVIRDNIDKQKCLKVMKCILLVISICAVSVIGFTIYRLKKPQNYISPVAKDSIEMQTAELLGILIILNLLASSGCSSTLIFPTLISGRSPAISSMTGTTIRQGAHQGAQKSKRTVFSESIISF